MERSTITREVLTELEVRLNIHNHIELHQNDHEYEVRLVRDKDGSIIDKAVGYSLEHALKRFSLARPK